MLRSIKNIVKSLTPILVLMFSICIPLGTVSAAIGDAPAVPILTSPSYGTTIASLKTRFEWSQSAGAVSYNLQLSTDFNFENLVIDRGAINNAYYDVPSLIKNTSYYWRVSANNPSATSDWSSMWYFKTAFSFVPNAPENLQATRVSSGRVNLSWNDKSDNEIRFVIERRTGQSPFVRINILNSNTTSYSDISAADNTVYYYRVKANGLAGDSGYSNEASAGPFLVNIPPPAPVITWPGEGYMIFTTEPQFQWQASSEAIGYTIQISVDADFTNIIYSQDNISNTFFNLPSRVLDWYESYSWRVNAKGGNGISSEWSSPGSFSVEPIDPITSSNRCSCGG